MWCTPQQFFVEQAMQWLAQCVVPHGMTHVLLMSQQLHCWPVLPHSGRAVSDSAQHDVSSIFDLHASAGGTSMLHSCLGVRYDACSTAG